MSVRGAAVRDALAWVVHPVTMVGLLVLVLNDHVPVRRRSRRHAGHRAGYWAPAGRPVLPSLFYPLDVPVAPDGSGAREHSRPPVPDDSA